MILMLCASVMVICAGAEEIPAPANELPKGFCYAHDLIPDVILDIRYAGTHNFVGDPIDGYEAPYAVMTVEAGEALKAAADEFREMGYRVKIYDAYRPQSAVKHFVRWAYDEDDKRMQEEFYPEFKKKILMVDQGYIARNSSHCRGSAIDLTLTDMEGNELDMGSCFDYFGKLSWHGAKGVSEEAAENRALLRRVMEKHGFRFYEKEWWHYKLLGEPFPDTAFDFPVK